MGRFKIWLEEIGAPQPTILRKSQYEEVQKLYDSAIKALGINGAPKAVATTTLKDIQDTDPNPNKPPQQGVNVVLNKLQHVFDQLSQVPHFEDRVKDSQNWLQKLSSPSSSGEPRPNDNIATLLKKMFGDDALETYGEKKWKGASAADPKQPQDSNMPGKDATSPPMGQETPPTGDANAPPGGDMDAPPGGDAGGGMPPPNAPPGDMGAPPAGGMPPDPSMGQQPDMAGGMPPDPSMGQQPDPTQPLQGPGGAFPKPPPGGLKMA